jgi:predicted AAA+ superfamily ATPase
MPRSRDYRRRILDDELGSLMGGLPAIALEGPKAVGKTATASERAASVHELDDPAQRALAEADPGRLLADPPPVLIDEWQFVPPIWDRIRRAVDADPSPGRFLLTGSSSPVERGTHSGAARVVSLRMRPLALAERLEEPPSVSVAELLGGKRPTITGQSSLTLEGYTEEILRSGFPGLRGLPERPLRAQLDAYLQRIVDRDFPELGHVVRNPALLRRWMAAYAAATATSTSFEKIRAAATGGEENKPAKTTAQAYRDVLERLFIVDDLPGWQHSRNSITQLALPSKHHLADPALAARLLGANRDRLLKGEAPGPSIPRDGTLLGALFESLVTLSVRVYAQAAEASVGHLRTRGGRHEVDLVVERDDGKVLAIEVKLGATPRNTETKHLTWLTEELGDELLDAVVITTGRDAYRREDGIAVVPAALLGP